MPPKGHRYKKGSFKGALGQHLVGKQVRSSHLGYDCYITGKINGDGNNGQCRAVLRPGRLPPSVTEDVRTVLPVEMWWPQAEHTATHGCIDAVLTRDYKSLEQWKRQWPDHQFGFEAYLVWCQRAAANGIAAPRVGTLIEETPGFTRANVAQSRFTPTRFPIGEEREKVEVGRIDREGYVTLLYVVTFRNLTSALRVDCIAEYGEGYRQLLGRAYVQLDDGAFQILEHHPGRCEVLGLPTDLIYRELGSSAPSRETRKPIMTSLRPRPESHELTPRQRSLEVTAKVANLPEVSAGAFESFPGPRQAP